jgi:hypothetical protein
LSGFQLFSFSAFCLSSAFQIFSVSAFFRNFQLFSFSAFQLFSFSAFISFSQRLRLSTFVSSIGQDAQRSRRDARAPQFQLFSFSVFQLFSSVSFSVFQLLASQKLHATEKNTTSRL